MPSVLRALPPLVVASVQPPLFALLFRHAVDDTVWSAVPLVALASTYFGVRLAGPDPDAPPPHRSPERTPST